MVQGCFMLGEGGSLLQFNMMKAEPDLGSETDSYHNEPHVKQEMPAASDVSRQQQPCPFSFVTVKPEIEDHYDDMEVVKGGRIIEECRPSVEETYGFNDHHETHSNEVATTILHQGTSSGRNCHTCKLCGRAFTTKGLLQFHMSSHTEEKPFACHICPKRYFHRRGLAGHALTHKRIQCEHCDEYFSSSRKLKCHTATHVSKDMYHCKQCSKRFCTSAQLANHCIQHLCETLHQCEQCYKSFSSPFSLRQHILTHTSEEIEKYYQCEYCTKCFAQRLLLVKHVLSHSDTQNEMHHCDTSQEFERRAKKHVPKKIYQCILCPMGFKSGKGLVRHNRTHLGAKPFRCVYCRKRYKFNSELQIHLEVHTGRTNVRIYNCDICKSTFSWRKSLVVHMQSHSASQTR